MTRAADLAGRRFGRLVALAMMPRRPRTNSATWNCRCDCGREREVRADNLTAGRVVSCGCYRAENGKKAKSSMQAKSAAAGLKTNRLARAFDAVFPEPPDTTHVDRPGARLVRGERY